MNRNVINKTGKITLLLGMIFLIGNILPSESIKQPETEVSASLIDENTLIYGVTSNPSGFDPLGVYDTTSKNFILNMFEGLFAYDYKSENMQIIPRLAKDMGTWDDTSKELTLSLREDVTWWDGTSFTAADAVWNLNRANTMAYSSLSRSASLWMYDGNTIIDTVEEIGTYEIKITLSALGLSDILNLLVTPWASFIKPNEEYSETTMTMDDTEDLMGTGPFLFNSYIAGEETTLTAYTDYFRGPARIPQIKFKFFYDAIALTDALFNKEIHLVRSIQDSQWDSAIADPNITVELLKGSCVYSYQMGVHTTPLAVRKAFQFAFNYSYVPSISVTLPAHNHPIPDGMQGYNSDLPGLPNYDLVKARNYMLNSNDPDIQTAIARNGIDADSTDEEWIIVAQSDDPLYAANFTHYGTSFYTFLANYAQDVGVDLINDQVGGWSDFLAWANVPANKATMQFSMSGWCPDYFEPTNMLTNLFTTSGSSNWNGLANATIDANIEAIKTLSGEDKLAMVDTVVTQIIVEQAAAMYTVTSSDLIAWNSNALTGLTDGTECFLNPLGDKYFYPITLGPFIDADEDGISDGDEIDYYGTDPNNNDTDDDGLDDYQEVYLFGTNPNLADSDDDGLTDFQEIDEYNTDPNLNDTDDDGLTDFQEIDEYDTDPNLNDTDDDGLTDFQEIDEFDTDPNLNDTDDDGLTDFQEIDEFDTDPNLNDTDDDGLTDFQEIDEYQTDPNLIDTDGDGFDDKEEIDKKTDPLDKDDFPSDDNSSDNPFDNILNSIPGFPTKSIFVISIISIGLLINRKNRYLSI